MRSFKATPNTIEAVITQSHSIVSASDFIAFMNELNDMRLVDRDGSKVSRNDIADHQLSWSVYFLDPDGNRFELTSYEYTEIDAHIQHKVNS